MRLTGFFGLGVAAIALTAIAVPAQAAITYKFEAFTTFDLGPTVGSFTYVAPDFITVDTTIATPGNCVLTAPVGLGCGPSQGFIVDEETVNHNGGDFYDLVSFGLDNGTGFYFYFENGALGMLGVHDNILFGAEQAGRLTITRDAVPEPASWAMMIAGFATLGGALRRRRVSIALA